MRRFSTLFLSGALVVSMTLLAGCSLDDFASDDPAKSAVRQAAEWTVLTDAQPSLTEEQQEVFTKAFQGRDDAVYQPVCVLGTQLVSGTNYAFLATAGSGENASWYVVIIYADLNGKATVSNVNQLDLNNPKTMASNKNGVLLGGWKLDSGARKIEPEEAANGFSRALASQNERDLVPIVTLAVKEGSPKHYSILSFDPDNTLIIVDVSVEQDGSGSFSNFSRLNFSAYVTGE